MQIDNFQQSIIMPIGAALRKAFSGHADYIGQQLDRRPHQELVGKTVIYNHDDCLAKKALTFFFSNFKIHYSCFLP